MDLNDLYATYSRIRENQATPCQMLKVILYAYMNRIYSSRPIESACKRDINFMYLLEEKPTNYEQSKTRKYKKDISRAENMIYDMASDSYTCKNGKKL